MSVSLVEDGSLQWPVYFLYPEYGESDFIEQFPENDRSSVHPVVFILLLENSIIL